MKSGKHILSWFFMLLFCCSINAQQTSSFPGTVPRVVNYSGKATDAQGKAISGVTDRFLSVTPTSSGICQYCGCPGPTFWAGMGGSRPVSQASITFFDISGVLMTAGFHLVVY